DIITLQTLFANLFSCIGFRQQQAHVAVANFQPITEITLFILDPHLIRRQSRRFKLKDIIDYMYHGAQGLERLDQNKRYGEGPNKYNNILIDNEEYKYKDR
ncbi:hypothetical protein ACJX0J_029027, partial [Zea mays]